MAKTMGESEGWDSTEAAQTYEERVGRQPAESMSGGSDRLSMPEESLAANDPAAFREQLPTQDGYEAGEDDQGDMGSDGFSAAAAEQLEDEPE